MVADMIAERRAHRRRRRRRPADRPPRPRRRDRRRRAVAVQPRREPRGRRRAARRRRLHRPLSRYDAPLRGSAVTMSTSTWRSAPPIRPVAASSRCSRCGSGRRCDATRARRDSGHRRRAVGLRSRRSRAATSAVGGGNADVPRPGHEPGAARRRSSARQLRITFGDTELTALAVHDAHPRGPCDLQKASDDRHTRRCVRHQQTASPLDVVVLHVDHHERRPRRVDADLVLHRICGNLDVHVRYKERPALGRRSRRGVPSPRS